MNSGYYEKIDLEMWREAELLYKNGTVIASDNMYEFNMYEFAFVGYAPKNVTFPTNYSMVYPVNEFLLTADETKRFVQLLHPNGDLVDTPNDNVITIIVDDESFIYYPQYVAEDGTILYHLYETIHVLP